MKALSVVKELITAGAGLVGVTGLLFWPSGPFPLILTSHEAAVQRAAHNRINKHFRTLTPLTRVQQQYWQKLQKEILHVNDTYQQRSYLRRLELCRVKVQEES